MPIKKQIAAAARFGLLLIPRLCIPVSFLLAVVIAPLSMLSVADKWPRMLGDMWDDPI